MRGIDIKEEDCSSLPGKIIPCQIYLVMNNDRKWFRATVGLPCGKFQVQKFHFYESIKYCMFIYYSFFRWATSQSKPSMIVSCWTMAITNASLNGIFGCSRVTSRSFLFWPKISLLHPPSAQIGKLHRSLYYKSCRRLL